MAISHDSNRTNRAASIMEERVFLELWKEMQVRVPHINHGYGALDLILNNKPIRCRAPGLTKKENMALIDSFSQRDAYVAASVIQFLGTKGGAIFIREAEERIAVEREKARIRFHRTYNLGELPISETDCFGYPKKSGIP